MVQFHTFHYQKYNYNKIFLLLKQLYSEFEFSTPIWWE